jgi:hypothetical protein
MRPWPRRGATGPERSLLLQYLQDLPEPDPPQILVIIVRAADLVVGEGGCPQHLRDCGSPGKDFTGAPDEDAQRLGGVRFGDRVCSLDDGPSRRESPFLRENLTSAIVEL